MSRKSVKFSNPSDPRTALVKHIVPGQSLRDSSVRYVKAQRRDGVNGLRITLTDMRSAWGRPEWRQSSLKFAHHGRK